MRIFWYFLGFMLLTTACLNRNNFSSDLKENYDLHQGFPLTVNSTPFDSGYTRAVAKLYRGNSYVASGAFISESGLFLTTYDPVLNLISSNPDERSVMEGFSATTLNAEKPIPGMALLVLIEERDVTHIFDEHIQDGLINAQINRAKAVLTQKLVAEESNGEPDIFVKVSELLSGNRQILSVYKILNDVRLVWAEGIADSASPFENSNELFDNASSKSSLVRAYIQPDGSSIGYNPANKPYSPEGFFKLPSATQENQKVYMFGFPERTFRIDTYRALSFYNSVTNPAIINTYQAYQKRLDQSAKTNTDFAYRTLYDRFNTALQISQYKAIQASFAEDDILELKNKEEFDLRLWLQTDTTGNSNFKEIFYYIDQAYDIAEQNGESFYTTSYALQLGRLDDLANLIKQFYEESALATSDDEVHQLQQQIVGNQQQILAILDIPSEINFLGDLLVILNSLPEDQSIPTIQQLFVDVPENQQHNVATAYLERQISTSFLFDVEHTQQAINNDEVYGDSLFTMLDEILFINDLSRNNHAIFLAYQKPALQVLTMALQHRHGHVFPDANGTLRLNKGYYKQELNKELSDYIITYNDFSPRSPGSVVINDRGEILGLVDQRVQENLISNYLFQKEHAYFFSRDVRSIATELEKEQTFWKSELFK